MSLALALTLAVAAPVDVAAPMLDEQALLQAVDEMLHVGLAAQDDDAPAPPPRKRRRDDDDYTPSASGPTFSSAGSAATPQGRQLGVGLQLGYPTALTLKYMLRPDQGVVVGVGALSGFVYDVGTFSLHGDWVFHPHTLTSSPQFALTWYVGIGANLVIFDYSRARQRPFLPDVRYFYYPTTLWLAARVPVGVNLAFAQVPFELYVEATPSLLVFPGLSFGLGAAIGGRFYF